MKYEKHAFYLYLSPTLNYTAVKELFTGVTSTVSGSLNVTVSASDAKIYRITF
jgi:hypothetical protein